MKRMARYALQIWTKLGISFLFLYFLDVQGYSLDLTSLTFVRRLAYLFFVCLPLRYYWASVGKRVREERSKCERTVLVSWLSANFYCSCGAPLRNGAAERIDSFARCLCLRIIPEALAKIISPHWRPKSLVYTRLCYQLNRKPDATERRRMKERRNEI